MKLTWVTMAMAALAAVGAGVWAQAAEQTASAPTSRPVINGYQQISDCTLPDYSWVPRKLVKEPKYASANPRYALFLLGAGRKTVVACVWDESGGTGSGYDTMYVDTNLSGDLTEQDKKSVWPNDPKRMPSEKYHVMDIKDADGEGTYDLKMETHGGPDVISYASSYSWKDKTGRTIFNLHHLPNNSAIQWGKSIADAPVHVLGRELLPLPSQPSTQDPPKNAALILPGTPLGKISAGANLTISWRIASLGSNPPVTELRCSAGSGQSYLRVLKPDGSVDREIAMAGGCACAESFWQSMIVPASVPPGNHLIVFRVGNADYVYPIEVVNPGYGQVQIDPAYQMLAGQFKDARIVGLRRAIEAEQLQKAFAQEQPVAALVSDNWMDCFHREGFLYYLNENRGADSLLHLGWGAWAADTNRGLIKVDLSGLPKDAKIHGAVLRLAVQSCTVPGDARLAAYALRRAWAELPGPKGYSCQLGPYYVPKADPKTGKSVPGENWAKPGAMDTQQDRLPEPAATVPLAALLGKAPAEASASAPAKAECVSFCAVPKPAFGGQSAQSYVVLDVSDVVRKWHSGALTNNGLVLEIQTAAKGGTLGLYASECDSPYLRPTLEVAYDGGEYRSVYTVPPGEDLAAARDKAKQEAKMLMIVFTSPACRMCDRFKQSVLGNAAVGKALAEKFVVQQLDVSNWPGLSARLGVSRVPTVLIVNTEDLAMRAREQGPDLMNADLFLEWLNRRAP